MIDPDGRALEVRYIPKPNTIVRKVTSEDEVKIGLDIPDDGLFLGFVAVNGEHIQTRQKQYVPYYLINDEKKTGDPLIFTHVLIAGMSGRGKTHVAKNFLRQIVGSAYPMERRRTSRSRLRSSGISHISSRAASSMRINISH
jgi:DNA helicase HerA-like ATPase